MKIFTPLFFERYYPYMAGATFTTWLAVLGIGIPLTENTVCLLVILSNILTGYMLMKYKSIDHSSNIMQDLRRAGYMKDFNSYFNQNTQSNLLFTVLCLLSPYFLDAFSLHQYVLVFFLIVSIFTFTRVMNLISKVLEYAETY